MGKNRISSARCVDRTVRFNLGRFLDSLADCFSDEGRELFKLSSASKPADSPDFEGWLRANLGGVTREQVAITLLGASLLSKFDDGDPSSSKQREAAAFSKWRLAEEQCFRTNELFSTRCSTEWSSVQPELFLAARKISSVLGAFNWDEVSDGFAFGPGATTRLGRGKRGYAHKFSGVPETTLNNLALATACIKSSPPWSESSFDESGNCVSIRNFNKVVTVPKNWKADRVISIEPCMNIYVQKGIGAVIRSRLHRVGINLSDQTYNQRLAREGSMLGRLATIDLSSASDTVSYEVVKDLLPEPWFTALEQCRTPSGALPSGEIVTYQKFSSMGNGYTFELETLIFWALASACAELLDLKDTSISVYGDDIIVDVRVVPRLLDVLRICGFTPNPQKSWWQGGFRESCGKHYFHGIDVTPFFIRRPIRRLTDLFLLHNNLRRWADRQYTNRMVNHHAVAALLSELRNLAPPKWRTPHLPDGFGDGAFIGTFDRVLPNKAPKGWDGWLAKAIIETSEVVRDNSLGLLVADLAMRKDVNAQFRLKESMEPFSSIGLISRKRVGHVFIPRSAEWPYLHELALASSV